MEKVINGFTWTIDDVLDATGGACLLGSRQRRFSGVSIDSRRIGERELFVAIQGDHHDGHDYLDEVAARGAGGVVVEEGRLRHSLDPLQKAGLVAIVVFDTRVALGDLARYQRRRAALPIVAITGTNGKTTTKDMAALVCGRTLQVLATAGNYNNAIGLPLTLLQLKGTHQVGILEMGMNAPGEIAYLAKISEPNLGVVLNIGPGHLAGVGSLEGVVQAKGELVESLGSAGTAILNADDRRVAALARKAAGKVVTFGRAQKADVQATQVRKTGAGLLFDLQLPQAGVCRGVKLPAFGDYILTNALAAAAIGDLLGVPGPEIKKGLESFFPAPGRMNIIQTAAGVYVIDDTYNANPGSMEAAISGLCAVKGENRGFLVVGDMYELGEYAATMHEEVGAMAAGMGLEAVYATGEFAGEVKQGALAEGMSPEKIFIGTKAEITGQLLERVCPGDWILIKGSRGMNMETVVTAVKERFRAGERRR